MTNLSTKDEALYTTLSEALPPFLISDFVKCQRLPSLPSVALRIIKLTQSSQATVNECASTIEHDPALTARLISLANSVHYTRSANPTQTCLEAVQRLGLDATLITVLSFNLFQHPSNGNHHTHLWLRAIMSALTARYLAQQVCPDQTGNAFTSALLQDIGILALSAIYPEPAEEFYLDSTVPHAHLSSKEQHYFGSDHATIGAWLAAKRGIPSSMVNAILYSHADYTSGSLMEFCVRLSGPIADACLSSDPQGQLSELLNELSTCSDLPDFSLESVLEQAQSKMALITDTLNIDAPATVDPKELLEDAQRLLLDHTLVINCRREAQLKALSMLRKGDPTAKKFRKDVVFRKI